MPIEKIHSFLVYPAKNEDDPPDISGTEIPLRRESKLRVMLAGVFDRSPHECNIDVVFRHNDDGEQENECRDLLLEYAARPRIATGRLIAERLQQVSTHRSGLGLLFLVKGMVDDNHQLVISRFPADQGVIAQERARELSVEFIERVFMKNSHAYKSALYTSDSLDRGFWDGHAVDRQITGPKELSDYWIQDFLKSELRTTGPAGTRRLANALRLAIRSSGELEVKHELIHAAGLLRNQPNQPRSTREMVGQLNLSDRATAAIESAFARPDLMDEVFRFDREEFQQHAPYRAIELDNGGMLIADDARFAQVFREQPVNQDDGRTRFVTEGRIVDESLRKMK